MSRFLCALVPLLMASCDLANPHDCPETQTPCEPPFEVHVVTDQAFEATTDLAVYRLTFREDGSPEQRCVFTTPFDQTFDVHCETGNFQPDLTQHAHLVCNVSLTPVLASECRADVGVTAKLLFQRIATTPPKGLSLSVESETFVGAPVMLDLGVSSYAPDGPSCPGSCTGVYPTVAFADLFTTGTAGTAGSSGAAGTAGIGGAAGEGGAAGMAGTAGVGAGGVAGASGSGAGQDAGTAGSAG